MSGLIPPEFGNLSFDWRYGYLNLSHNQLSGSIPKLGKASSLTSLDLSHNQLSGTIPSSVTNIGYLNSLDLSHNRFTFDGMELIAKKFPFAKYGRQANIPLYLNNNTF